MEMHECRASVARRAAVRPHGLTFRREIRMQRETMYDNRPLEIQPAVHGADPADEQAVRDLFRRLLEAWGRGDGDAYGALFTEDADYVAFDGSSRRGTE